MVKIVIDHLVAAVVALLIVSLILFFIISIVLAFKFIFGSPKIEGVKMMLTEGILSIPTDYMVSSFLLACIISVVVYILKLFV